MSVILFGVQRVTKTSTLLSQNIYPLEKCRVKEVEKPSIIVLCNDMQCFPTGFAYALRLASPTK